MSLILQWIGPHTSRPHPMTATAPDGERCRALRPARRPARRSSLAHHVPASPMRVCVSAPGPRLKIVFVRDAAVGEARPARLRLKRIPPRLQSNGNSPAPNCCCLGPLPPATCSIPTRQHWIIAIQPIPNRRRRTFGRYRCELGDRCALMSPLLGSLSAWSLCGPRWCRSRLNYFGPVPHRSGVQAAQSVGSHSRSASRVTLAASARKLRARILKCRANGLSGQNFGISLQSR